MAILPDFELPSDPSKTVRLREATVADAIDFSDINRECEEEATTLFLDRLQEKEKYSDPRLWTAEDRRFALFMYHLHTTTEKDYVLEWVCDTCTKDPKKPVKHAVAINLADIASEYTPIEGKPVRDVIHEGHAILVHPLLGKDAELLEKSRMNISLLEKSGEPARKERNQLTFLRLLCCMDIVGLDPDATPEERRPKVEEFITKMSISEFLAFRPKILSAMDSLKHGLRSTFVDGRIMLESPVVYCPEDTAKERGLRLQFPFRTFEYIPVL